MKGGGTILLALALVAGCASDSDEPAAATKAPGESAAPTTGDAPADVPAASETTPGEATVAPTAPQTEPSPNTAATEEPEPEQARADLAPGEWVEEFDEDGASLTPPFEEASGEHAGLVARDGVAVPGTLDIAAFLRGQPADPTNCFAEVTFNLAQGGNYGPVINHNGPASGAAGRVRSGYFLGWYQGDEAIRLYAAERPDPIATYFYGSRPDRDVTLRIERRGNELEVFVDGESVMTAKASDELSASEGTWVGMFYRGTETYDQIGYFTRFSGGSL